MEQRKQHRKTLALFCVSTLLILAIIAAVIINDTHSSNQSQITLPEQSLSQGTETQNLQVEQISVNKGNVQKIVSSIQRPNAYHQSFSVSGYADDSVMEKTVELWVSDDLLRAVVTTPYEGKNLLANGEMIYIWYDDAANVSKFPRREDTTLEELLGIPTYEDLQLLSQDQILSGAYLTEQDDARVSAIYASALVDGCSREYWIDLTSGLLYRYQMTDNGEPVTELKQIQYDALASSDEAFADVFRLPNGTDPFAS